MKSSNAGKLFIPAPNPKSKKNSKDREKRKSQSTSELTNQHNSDKGSPSKDGNTRKYAGYGPEQLTVMAEQAVFEHLSEDVCMSFTEDINYKLRQVIYDALARARLSSRNYITSTDIDDTFECLQIEKVYGAPTAPNWFMFGDQNLYYLDDSKINLIEIAEEQQSFIQPLEPSVTRKWLPESREISKELKVYFMLMCQAVVENDQEVRLTALKDISENHSIGPIIEWFYHFGYFLLSKDITYDSLTLFAFDLLEALESNPISALIVSDKQIILLARLLLQRLLRSITTPHILKPLCQMLAIICKRVPVRKIILKKIISKFPEIRDDFALPVICAINELGMDAISSVFLPHLNCLLFMIEDDRESNFVYDLLRSYNILCLGGINFISICDLFYEVFGDGVIPIWKHGISQVPSEPLKTDCVWLNMKLQLLKSRRKFFPCNLKSSKRIHIEEAFPEGYDDNSNDIKKEIFEYEFQETITDEIPIRIEPTIAFKFHSFTPTTGRLRFLNQARYQATSQITANYVIIGKRTLLAPELTNIRNSINNSSKCINHSIMYHNL